MGKIIRKPRESVPIKGKKGKQEYVRYCPNCKGDIRPVPANNQHVETSHRYKCGVCEREFEINDLYVEYAIQ
jgi:transposase-like protein